MQLPQREYYYLKEISQIWPVTDFDIQYYLENGILQAMVWLNDEMVELGRYTDNKGFNFMIVEDTRKVSGLYPLCTNDCRLLFKDGFAKICYLKSDIGLNYCRIISGDLQVKISDLVVTRLECGFFEGKRQANNKKFKYSDDFSTVILGDYSFNLGRVQANVVRLLHNAYLNKQPWLYGKEVLYDASAETMRMVDLFKSQKNWRRLIDSDGRGKYKINLS